jgi:hypothetical protein
MNLRGLIYVQASIKFDFNQIGTAKIGFDALGCAEVGVT